MAHELEVIDGQASMISVRQTPWHQLGHVLPDAPSFEEMMTLARLDYTVELRELFYRRDIREGEYIDVPSGARAIVRSDNHVELGVATEKYTPVQNREAFAVLEPLIDAELATVETAGVLRNGADAWALIAFNPEKMGPAWQGMNAKGDVVLPYGLVATNHSGRRGVMLKNTPVRVVCANTLGMAEAGRETQGIVYHRANATDRLVTLAQDIFASTYEAYETTALAYTKLRSTLITARQFEQAILDVIAPLPTPGPRFDPSSRMAQTVLARVTEKRETLHRLWMSGTGQDGTPSAWAAYQSVTEALDHNVDDRWNTRGERPASLLDGPLAQAKRKVLDNLMALA